MYILGLFLALLLLILMGFPIYLVFGIIVIMGYVFTPDLVLTIVPQKIFGPFLWIQRQGFAS